MTRASRCVWRSETGQAGGSAGRAGDRFATVGRQRHEALLLEIAVVAHRLVGDVLVDELLQARDDANVLLLHVDVERARQGYLPEEMFVDGVLDAR